MQKSKDGEIVLVSLYHFNIKGIIMKGNEFKEFGKLLYESSLKLHKIIQEKVKA